MNIGLVHVEFQHSRGQADEALLGHIQRYSLPSTTIHDNAREFTDGNFAKICKEKGITQRISAPYTPNQNPAEKYMDVLVSGARSLLRFGNMLSNIAHTCETSWPCLADAVQTISLPANNPI
jgi:transposase InsO family protein